MKSLLDKVVGAARAPEWRANVPIFPLHSVLFPGGTLALKIFETRYMDMAKACLKNDSPFGIALIREGSEVGVGASPYAVGTLARIRDWDMKELGILHVTVLGESRFRLLSYEALASGLLIGEVSLIAEDVSVDCEASTPCAGILRTILASLAHARTPRVQETHFDDAVWVSNRLTEILPLGNAVKQKMLELTDVRIRLDILRQYLVRQRLLAS